MTTTTLSQFRPKLTRFLHRAADLKDIAAFSLCPLSSWSTQLHLPATQANKDNGNTGDRQGEEINLKIDQWTSLGSGGFVWGGARRLASRLQKQGHLEEDQSSTTTTPTKTTNRPWSGLNVIELGAGTGLLGIAVAAMGANVTLTDQANFVYPDKDSTDRLENLSLLDLLRTNAQHNLNLTQDPGQQNVQVHEMLWGSASHHAALPSPGTFDWIVAADILLFASAHRDLIQTLTALSTPKTVILIEHTDRGDGDGQTYPNDLLNFLDLLDQDNNNNDKSNSGTWKWKPEVIHHYGRHITLRITREEGENESQNL